MATKKKTTALSWIVNEAKSLKKKYPKRFATWKEYVAQASAIYASKHKGKSPVGKKKIAAPDKVKKTTIKPKVKKVVAKAKAKKSPVRSMHKDTKSHNVNIRVMSGTSGNIGNISIDQIKRNNESIERLTKVLMDNKEKMKFSPYKTIFWQNYFKQKNKEISDYIKTLKKQNTSLKKHIK